MSPELACVVRTSELEALGLLGLISLLLAEMSQGHIRLVWLYICAHAVRGSD